MSDDQRAEYQRAIEGAIEAAKPKGSHREHFVNLMDRLGTTMRSSC